MTSGANRGYTSTSQKDVIKIEKKGKKKKETPAGIAIPEGGDGGGGGAAREKSKEIERGGLSIYAHGENNKYHHSYTHTHWFSFSLTHSFYHSKWESNVRSLLHLRRKRRRQRGVVPDVMIIYHVDTATAVVRSTATASRWITTTTIDDTGAIGFRYRRRPLHQRGFRGATTVRRIAAGKYGRSFGTLQDPDTEA